MYHMDWSADLPDWTPDRMFRNWQPFVCKLGTLKYGVLHLVRAGKLEKAVAVFGNGGAGGGDGGMQG